jgi:hypothetical protein
MYLNCRQQAALFGAACLCGWQTPVTLLRRRPSMVADALIVDEEGNSICASSGR